MKKIYRKSLISIQISADTGPKPTVELEIESIDNETENATASVIK